MRPNRLNAQLLSPRQYEILQAVWRGQTNKAMAADLGISLRTVEVHRASLMRRLKVTNAAQLIRAALQRNLLQVRS